MSTPEHRYPTHAGAVVCRGYPDLTEFLLVSASEDRSEWVLPKGHIEPGEDPRSAACREVQEEAGVNIELVGGGELGMVSYLVRGTAVRVIYYLARYLSDASAAENRATMWMPVQAAASGVAHEETRDIIRFAITRLNEMTVAKSRPPSSRM